MRAAKEPLPTEVFAGTQIEASIVKSLLESAEIGAFLKDETMGTLNPWHVTAGGVNPVKVIVSSEDAGRALSIIEEYRKNQKKG